MYIFLDYDKSGKILLIVASLKNWLQFRNKLAEAIISNYNIIRVKKFLSDSNYQFTIELKHMLICYIYTIELEQIEKKIMKYLNYVLNSKKEGVKETVKTLFNSNSIDKKPVDALIKTNKYEMKENCLITKKADYL